MKDSANTINRYIHSQYGFEVKDTKIHKIQTDPIKYTIHTIHERSVNNKVIRVTFSMDKESRITLFIRHGSELAKLLDPVNTHHFW